jgi:Chagasin family peptidase inhibitor I42
MRRTFALAGVLALVLVAAGCGPTQVRVPMTAGTATLRTGETLRVDFGTINTGIGDAWFIMTQPDGAILTESDQIFDSACGQPGCDSRMAWTFKATGAGTTTVVFRYCYRSRLDNCDPGPGRGPKDPVPLAVTVTK